MSKNKSIKSVSFNITNENDLECLEHTKNANFSGYVKSLILADIQIRKEARKIIHKSQEGGFKIIVGR